MRVMKVAAAGALLAGLIASVGPSSRVDAAFTDGPELVPFIGTFKVTATWGAPSGGYHAEGDPAIDVSMPVGTPIYATGDGWVAEDPVRDTAHCNPLDYKNYVQGCIDAGYGNSGTRIKIRHPNGTVSLYLHLSSVRADLRKDSPVSAGMQIGESGNTGISEGPHLHYAEYVGGNDVDPGFWSACHGASRVTYDNLKLRKGQFIRNDGYGCALPADADGDGIADSSDSCPSQAGALVSNGCPLVVGVDRVAVLQTGGRLSVKDGPLNATYQELAGNVSAFQLEGDRVAVLTGTDLYVKDGPLNATYENLAGDLKTFQIGADEDHIRRSGQLAVSYGPVSMPATQRTPTNGADPSVALSSLNVPSRLLDTRPGSPTADGQFSSIGAVQGGTTLELQVIGRAGVPSNATTAVLNVTATEPTGPGYVTVYPCGATRPTASNLNYTAGQTIPNAVIAKIGTGGKICFFSQTTTHLIVDVASYFISDSGLSSLNVPSRLLDTRPGSPTADGQFSSIGAVQGGTTLELQVIGRAGVPSNATTAVLNVTATEPTGPGYVTVYPCGATRPTASNLNYTAGQTIPNAVIAKIGTGGKICFFSQTTTHLIVDIASYFT